MPNIDPHDQSQRPPDREAQRRILRDYLAYDRTVMANERSLLAFVRTGLTSVVTGLAFLELVDAEWASYAGWALVAVGPLFVVYGVHRFWYFKRRYGREMEQLPE